MAEECVIEKRPDERAHLARVSFDELRLVDAVDQNDDPDIAERAEHRLELAQEFVALFRASFST